MQDGKESQSRSSLPGPRFVVGLLGAPVLVAVIVILAGIAVLANRGDDDDTCDAEPAVCDAVQRYVDAFNDRDATAILGSLTNHGLRSLFDIDSRSELERRLRRLTPADRIEGVEITRMSVEGDRALVVAVYEQREDKFNAVYQLVRRESGWLIDG